MEMFHLLCMEFSCLFSQHKCLFLTIFIDWHLDDQEFAIFLPRLFKFNYGNSFFGNSNDIFVHMLIYRLNQKKEIDLYICDYIKGNKVKEKPVVRDINK